MPGTTSRNRQVEMADEQRDRDDGDRAPARPAIDDDQQVRRPGNPASGIAQRQGRRDEEDRQHDQRHDRGQDIAETDRAGDVPGPRLDDAIGAIERDPKRLDAVGREIEGREHRDGEQAAARDGEDLRHLAGDRIGDRRRQVVEDQMNRGLGELVGAEKGRKRRAEDQERKDRQQRRERHMARHGPAVILGEMPERIEAHLPRDTDEARHSTSLKQFSGTMRNRPHLFAGIGSLFRIWERKPDLYRKR
jgi:hypothetical protein